MSLVKVLAPSLFTSLLSAYVFSTFDEFRVYFQNLPVLLNTCFNSLSASHVTTTLLVILMVYVRSLVIRIARIPERYFIQMKASGVVAPASDNTEISQDQGETVVGSILVNDTLPEIEEPEVELETSSDTIFLGSFVYSSTTPLTAPLASITWDAFKSSAVIKRIFLENALVALDLKIRIHVNASDYLSGLLIAANVAEPEIIPNTIGAVVPSYACTSVPPPSFRSIVSTPRSVFINVSKTAVYDVNIPFTYNMNFLSSFNYTTINSWFTVYIVPATTLRTFSGGPSAVNFQVYGMVDSLRSYDKPSLVIQGGVRSMVDKVADTALPIIRNVAGIFDFLGLSLDAPSDVRNPPPFFSRLFQKFTSRNMVLDVHKVASPSDELCLFEKKDVENYSLVEDEMSMAFLRKIWFHVDVFQFSSTSTTTATNYLFAIPLTPCPYLILNRTAGTLCTALVQKFDYWKGSLIYEIQLVRSKFTTGKLCFAVIYHSVNNTRAALKPDPLTCPHVIVDLASEETSLSINVPFKSTRAYLSTFSASFTSGMFPEDLLDRCMGELVCYPIAVMNPFNAPTVMDIQVSVRFGDDFNLYRFHPTSTYYQAQSSLAIKNSLPPIGLSLTPIVSLRDMLFAPVEYHKAILTNTVTIPISVGFLCKHPVWSFFINSYVGYRGSLRLIVTLENVSSTARTFVSCQIIRGRSFNGPAASALTSNNECWSNGGLPPVQPTTNIGGIVAPGCFSYASRTHYPSVSGKITANLSSTQSKVYLSASSPQIVMETPSPCMTRKSPPFFSSSGAYSANETLIPIGIQRDPSLYYLMCVLETNGTTPPTGNVIVSVSVLPSDDFRFFWHRGFPDFTNNGILWYDNADIGNFENLPDPL